MIKVGDSVVIKDKLPGYFIPQGTVFEVKYLTKFGTRAYITKGNIALEIDVVFLELVDKKEIEKKNIVCFTGKEIELNNKLGATAKIYYGFDEKKKKYICIELCTNTIVKTFQESLEDTNVFLKSLGFKETLVKNESVTEIMEEMKKISKSFELKKEQYSVYINYEQKKVYAINRTTYDNVGTLYFDKKTSEQLVNRLQMAYDREGWK